MNLPINDAQKMNEIIFANRNKSYGAYAIRSSYNSTLAKSLGAVSSTVLLFMLLAYVFTHQREEIKPLDPEGNLKTIICSIEPNVKKPETAVVRTRVTPPSNPARQNGLSATIIDTTAENNTSLNVENNFNGNTTNPGTESTGTNSGTGTTTATGTGTENNFLMPKEPTAFVDEQPEFEGGLQALYKFFKDNTVYPPGARGEGIEGTVYLSFVIDETGNVGSVQIQKGVAGGLTEEASRVVSMLPKFKKPGKIKGQAVKTIYNIPFKFRLK
jgi:periplasmic protein TonB